MKTHQQMVDEQLAALSSSSAWADLRARAMSGGVVEGFGRAAAALLQRHDAARAREQARAARRCARCKAWALAWAPARGARTLSRLEAADASPAAAMAAWGASPARSEAEVDGGLRVELYLRRVRVASRRQIAQRWR
jgi:hypothetical protein